MNEREKISTILHVLAESIESWTPSELADLFDGNVTLRPSYRSSEPKSKSAPKRSLTHEQLLSYVSDLKGVTSREEGHQKLVDIQGTRKELEQISRFLDLPVAKHDSVETLKQNIVEEVIGASLNSRAIRGA